LRSTRALAHLPALAHDLGFEPTWHELAWEALRLPPGAAPPAARLAVVGRRTGLACFALESADAARAARWLAGALLARGQPALVLALDPATALLAVTAA